MLIRADLGERAMARVGMTLDGDAAAIGTQDAAAIGAAGTTRSARLGAALMAGLLGLVMLFGVGFAQIGAVHNAAHDTRHSIAFPCH